MCLKSQSQRIQTPSVHTATAVIYDYIAANQYECKRIAHCWLECYELHDTLQWHTQLLQPR